MPVETAPRQSAPVAHLAAALSRIVNRAAMALNAVGTLFVMALVIVVVADVIARGVFTAPFNGAVELVEFSVVFIVFLQLTDVVRVQRMTRSDGALNTLTAIRPGIARWLRVGLDLLSAIFMGLIATAIFPEFTDAWVNEDFVGTPGIFTVPAWPIKLAIFTGSGLCALRFWLTATLSILQRGESHEHA
ncbi:TRAP transporter small permease subunit [Nisaea sp.]|uniref:TRAP transporter small permease subunit n=1 Tax=Nisaea sp. TaxID=2024842 RepID=UPI0032EE29BE